jgi:hypothetical protein
MEWELGDRDISDDPRVFQDGIAYEGASRGEENGELMLNIAIVLQAFDLF